MPKGHLFLLTYSYFGDLKKQRTVVDWISCHEMLDEL